MPTFPHHCLRGCVFYKLPVGEIRIIGFHHCQPPGTPGAPLGASAHRAVENTAKRAPAPHWGGAI